MFAHFGLLESISVEQKTRGQGQNFVLFLNMGLEMLYLFPFKNSEGFFERPEKLFLMVNQQILFTVEVPFRTC